MDKNSQNELNSIKDELQSIVDELRSISNGVNDSFQGIGNGQCAAQIATVAEHYSQVKRTLDNIDTNALSDEFIAKQEAACPKPSYNAPVVSNEQTVTPVQETPQTNSVSKKPAKSKKKEEKPKGFFESLWDAIT